MTSEPTEAFVWTWLPGTEAPVVAGRLELVGGIGREEMHATLSQLMEP